MTTGCILVSNSNWRPSETSHRIILKFGPLEGRGDLQIALSLPLFMMAVIFLPHPLSKMIEHRPAGSAKCAGTILPYDALTISTHVKKVWSLPTHPLELPGNRSMPMPLNHLFATEVPDQWHVRDWKSDASLRRYFGLASESRRNDTALEDPSGEYWPSEYYSNGKPVGFHASFIMHLEPAGPSETIIDVIEYNCQIWVGETFGWSSHTGPVPGWFRDTRWVAPTDKDRCDVLNAIVGSLQQENQSPKAVKHQ